MQWLRLLCLLLLLPVSGASAGELQLNWTDNATTEAGFEVERRLDGEPDFANIATLSAPDTETYLDDKVPDGAKATYRVRAWNHCCSPAPCQPQLCLSAWSNEASAIAGTGTPPDTLLTLACTRSEEPEPTSPYDLLVSTSPDRSNPMPLQGETVSGEVYIFVDPETDIDQVRFWLDDSTRSGTPTQTEGISPYDFAGSVGSAGTDALPFDTSAIANGPHTISVEIDANGEVNAFILDRTFTVQN